MVSSALRSLIFSFAIILILILVITYFRTPTQTDLIEDRDEVVTEDRDEVVTEDRDEVNQEDELIINLSRNSGTSSEPQITAD